MKKNFILFMSLLSITALQAQKTEISSVVKEDLVLKELFYDFGKIPQSKPVYHEFVIVNDSKEPLQLNSVTATCGCTTPEWSREPIAPGASAQIKVGFNAAAEGPFEKFVNITYNNDKTKVFTIKGNVWKAPAGSAPSNASIQFLKQINQ
ncbi:MAG: DUF1573 domain-containing protein [Chitinophagaceae bacterium]|nr:DUF1573 domain-containing protein [Chitinophagaceae bacterium]